MPKNPGHGYQFREAETESCLPVPFPPQSPIPEQSSGKLQNIWQFRSGLPGYTAGPGLFGTLPKNKRSRFHQTQGRAAGGRL